MGAAYAVLGLVVGIVMDEVIRRRARSSGKPSGPPGPRRQSELAARDGSPERPIRRSSRRFPAQDYYDR